MKWFMVLLLVAAFLGDLDLSQVPEECQGKEIRCQDGAVGSCTLMHCPGSTVYGPDGRVLYYEAPCSNTCNYAMRCSCEGNSFFIRIRNLYSGDHENDKTVDQILRDYERGRR
jgi:hypothetical protein